MATAISGSLVYAPPGGYNHIVLISVATTNITAISGFNIADTIEWQNPSNQSNAVTINNSAEYAATPGDTFNIRYFSLGGGVWNAFALQEVPVVGGDSGGIIGKAILESIILSSIFQKAIR